VKSKLHCLVCDCVWTCFSTMKLGSLAVTVLLSLCCSAALSREVITVALVQSRVENYAEAGAGRTVKAAELAVNRTNQDPSLLPNHTLEVDTIQVEVSIDLQYILYCITVL